MSRKALYSCSMVAALGLILCTGAGQSHDLFGSVIPEAENITASSRSDPPYIFGIHDPGGEYLMEEKGRTGWVVVTEAIGHNPGDWSGPDYSWITAGGHGVIARLNNGYGSSGTIPRSGYYGDFAQRCGNFAQSSSGGAHIWIIGNEPNLGCEWPDDVPIYPSDYINCYLQCRANIRSRPGHESDQVIPAAIGTYAAGSPPTCVGDWIDYFAQVLQGVEGQCDAITVHTYTHGTDPALIFSEVVMAPPYDDRYYHFRAYRNYMWAIPAGMRGLPVYITETDQMPAPGFPAEGWADVNSGWVRNAYAEINAWNSTPGNQVIRSVCLYRWWPDDVWCWQYKEGVKNDFRDAMNNDYRWGDPTVEGNDAAFEGETVPESLAPSGSAAITVTVRNTGTTTWTFPALYRLGGTPANDFVWSDFAHGGYCLSPTDCRVFLAEGESIAPGATKTFSFRMTAPASPGTYTFGCCMVQDGVQWFGPSLEIPVVVGGGPSCPYSSLQARMQKDVADHWGPDKTIGLGREIRLGIFYDGVGLLADDAHVSLTFSGPGGYVAHPENGAFITPPAAGDYTLTGTCGVVTSDTAVCHVEAAAEFTLDMVVSYSAGTLGLDFTLGTPEPAAWANYLALTFPSVQVIPLWTVSLPAIDPPMDIPISFPFPSLGSIGIYTGLFTAGGAEAVILEWVDTGL